MTVSFDTPVDTSAASTPARQAQKDKPEDVRYTNYLRVIDGKKFKLGAMRLVMSNETHAALIPELDKGIKRVQALVKKRVIGKFNPGKGNSEGSYFVNLFFVSDDKVEVPAGFLRLEETNPAHEQTITDLLADPDSCTALIRACELTYNSGKAVKHTITF